MLIKLLSRQIPEYEEIINECIRKTLPAHQIGMLAEIYSQLLGETAQCWISTREGHYEGVFLTRIEEDAVLGGRMLCLLCGHAPGGLTGSGSVLDGFETMKKFALGEGCDRISFYTNNPEVEKYLTMFPVLWQTHYYQLDLKEA